MLPGVDYGLKTARAFYAPYRVIWVKTNNKSVNLSTHIALLFAEIILAYHQLQTKNKQFWEKLFPLFFHLWKCKSAYKVSYLLSA